MYIHNTKKGYALLLAAIIGSAMMTVGLAIFNLTIREVKLVAIERESQLAFYAADTGLECALYWDIKYGTFGAFATSSQGIPATPPSAGVECANGRDLPTEWAKPLPAELILDTYNATTTFLLQLGVGPDDPCVLITVAKTNPSLNHSFPSRTKIESRGKNTCTATNKIRAERALRATF